MELVSIPKKRQKSCYRECMRNHAAKIGGHAVDGCGQYIPSPSSNRSDPTSLICAACGCHRNFHLRPRPRYGDGYNFDLVEDEATQSDVLLSPKILGEGKKNKRHRSKFSREQQEGMMELAERVGWRLQKREDGLVEEACRKIGVTREVFKVWMHNHKQSSLASKSKVTNDEGVAPNANGDGDSGDKQQVESSSSPA